jgi:TolA-binding protein
MRGRAPIVTRAACTVARAVLLLGARHDDATTRVRVDRHVDSCSACQEVRRSLEETRAHVRAAVRPLDDVHRARLLARLAPALDEHAARAATAIRHDAARPGRGLARMRAAVAMIAAGAAAVALGVALHRAPEPARSATAPPLPTSRATSAAPRPAAASASSVERPTGPALIAPYEIVAADGSGERARARLLDQRFSRLQTAPGTTVRAHVGERTRVTLVGPADVSVGAATPELLDVNLDAGMLVADFVHRNSGRLRIHSPGVVTEVVGTLFSVEVRGDESRVSVARGRVVVQPIDGAPRVVSAGQSWTSGTVSMRAVPAMTAAALADHDAAIAGRGGARSPPAPTAEAGPETPSPRVLDSASAPQVAQALLTSASDAGSPNVPPQAGPSPLVTAQPQTATPTQSAPPQLVPPKPAAAAPALPADEVYAEAEAAMRRRDWRAAAGALERVVTQAAPGALADQARYELAQLAVRGGDFSGATRWLDALLASDREPALRQPAAFLRCEVATRSGSSDSARRCWEGFRARFPDSSRDALALGWLLRLEPAAPCATMGPLFDEYLRRYPTGADAALAREHKGRCAPSR